MNEQRFFCTGKKKNYSEMTSLQNDELQRKSSVYNQTGQNYFEQLSAYNRMSSHLRRILMAQRVVDSRNKKYMREKRLASRSSSCSKALDQIVSRRDIIDGVAYDTEHHPIDLLRMKLGCDPECPQRMKKRVFEQSYRICNNAQCRGASPKTARRTECNSDILRQSTIHNTSPDFKSDNRASRSPRLTGRRSTRQPEIDNSRRRNDYANRVGRPSRKNRNFQVIDETYCYDSSFESDTSEIDSALAKRIDFSPSKIEANQPLEKIIDNDELSEEAKYAKFLYDITQEIVSNGLYRDQEIRETFKRHVEMNLENLDRDKMSSEINQLKKSLNMKEISDEDEENEKCLCSGKLAKKSSSKSPKTLRKKRITKSREDQEKSICFEDSSEMSDLSRTSENTNREILISEKEVLVTLMEMKLDPRQVRTICKSLRNRSKETTPLRTVTNGGVTGKALNCTCQCGKENTASDFSRKETRGTESPMKARELRSNERKPEMGMRIKTSTSLDGMTRETKGVRLKSSEVRDMPDSSGEPKKMDNSEARLEDSNSLRTSRTSEDMEDRSEEKTKNKKNEELGKISMVRNDGTHENSPILFESTNVIDSTLEEKDADASRKIGEKPTKIESDISEESEAKETSIHTERDSAAIPEREKIDEMTDGELASLTEDISRVEESSSSTRDSEKGEKSKIPMIARPLEKSAELETDDSKFTSIIDESEEEKMYAIGKFDRATPKHSKSENEDTEVKVVGMETDVKDSSDNENGNLMRKKGLTDSPLSMNFNDDGIKTQYEDDDSSISERLEHRGSLASEDKIIGTEANDLARTKDRSTNLKKKKRPDKSMSNASKADKKINKRNSDKR